MRIRFLQTAVLTFAISLVAASQLYAADVSERVTCKDGTTSKAGKEACSHHGGKQKAGATSATQSATAPFDASETPTPPKRAKATRSTTATSTGRASNNNSAEPTARCKDGSVWYKKNHKGACLNHGGVKRWY